MKRPPKSGFVPLAERVRESVPTEKHAAERQKLRQKALLETLLRAHAPAANDLPPAGRSFREGLIVVIATYNDGRPLLDPWARINTVHHLLLALEHQRPALPDKARDNFKIVIADNGMTEDQRSRLRDYFTSLRAQAKANKRTAPEFLIVEAPKIRGNDYTRTAGYARNIALREIRRRRGAGDRSFAAPVLVHDDDTVTDGIGDMYKLLSRNRNVVGAVAPRVHGVRDIFRRATEIRSHPYEHRRGTAAQCSSFPPVFDRDGLINFSVLFAFGGSRIPKTCSLLLHPRAIDDLRSVYGEVFHVWRKGSFEDMCCSICLACLNWDVYRCESAHAYDQIRGSHEARLRQQFGWAYDHATAFYDFSEVSNRLPEPVVHRGVSVLAPLPKAERTPELGWGLQRLTRLPGFPGLQATIVRPAEVQEILGYIRDRLNTPKRARAFARNHNYAFEGCFESTAELAATVQVAWNVIGQVLWQLHSRPMRTIEIPFVDYKRIYRRSGDRSKHAEAFRYERDARVARILGNLGSMFRNSANDFTRGIVRYVTLGPRQAL